jgi:hypothetical protein
MNLRIAAIRSGSDPVRKLVGRSFHRALETQLICQKCDATYILMVDYDQSNDRWFPDESRLSSSSSPKPSSWDTAPTTASPTSKPKASSSKASPFR